MTKAGYKEIAAHFRRLIKDGTLRPGETLPTMAKVKEEFGVTVATANKAYQLLKAEGYTIPKVGAGTVVAERPQFADTGSARLERLERTGKHYAANEHTVDNEVWHRSIADPDIAAELGVEREDEIVIRKRVFVRDDKRVIVGLSFISTRGSAAVPEVHEVGPMPRFWQHLYTERTGKAITKSPERRTARLASQDELDAMQINVPRTTAVAVLVLQNTFYDEDGPLEVWEDVYAPGMWQEDAE